MYLGLSASSLHIHTELVEATSQCPGRLSLSHSPLSLWDQADEEGMSGDLSSLAVGHTQLLAALAGRKHPI